LIVRFRFSNSVSKKLAASIYLYTLSEECIFDILPNLLFIIRAL
jgi:hypothetical protein